MAVWLVSCLRRRISLKPPPLVPTGKKDGCAPDPTWRRILPHEESPWHERESRVPFAQEAGWIPGAVWVLWKLFLCICREFKPRFPVIPPLHPFQLDLPISIPFFEYLTMVYANTEAL